MTGNISAMELCWGNAVQAEQVMGAFPDGRPPLVIAADCVYWECLFDPLFQTLKYLVSRGEIELLVHTSPMSPSDFTPPPPPPSIRMSGYHITRQKMEKRWEIFCPMSKGNECVGVGGNDRCGAKRNDG